MKLSLCIETNSLFLTCWEGSVSIPQWLLLKLLVVQNTFKCLTATTFLSNSHPVLKLGFSKCFLNIEETSHVASKAASIVQHHLCSAYMKKIQII